MYYGLLSLAAKVPAPSFTGLLDTYSGAAAAYSAARRLSSTYTGALIRVRRSSDNTEQDIGYNGSNVLDQSALTTFVGAGNGFVTTWYDQSGNGNNVTQSTAAAQPRIVTSGTVLTENSKPCIKYLGNQYLGNTTTGLIRLDQKAHFIVFKEESNIYYAALMTYAPNSGNDYSASTGGVTQTGDGGGQGQLATNFVNSTLFISGSKPTPYMLASLKFDSTTAYLQKNNGTFNTLSNAYSANTFNSGAFYIGARYYSGTVQTSASTFVGTMQEAILYNGSSQNSNMSAINTNINTFYSIY